MYDVYIYACEEFKRLPEKGQGYGCFAKCSGITRLFVSHSFVKPLLGDKDKGLCIEPALLYSTGDMRPRTVSLKNTKTWILHFLPFNLECQRLY